MESQIITTQGGEVEVFRVFKPQAFTTSSEILIKELIASLSTLTNLIWKMAHIVP
jgi:hypothetical protein